MYSMSWKLYRRLQMKGWLTCSSIRRSRMMFRTLSDRTTAGKGKRQHEGADRPVHGVRGARGGHTFILSDVLEGKRQSGIFPLDNSYFAESAAADDTKQSEVVEVHWQR